MTSFVVLLTLGLATGAGGAQSSVPVQDGSAAVRRFVQDFYNWYVPNALRDGIGRPAALALKERRSLFTAELYRALDSDFRAQLTASELVSIDYDPFLNAQDPCERYDVGRVAASGSTYLVDVHGICEGKRRAVPDVVAEVVLRNGKWVFSNFRDVRNRTDLLRELEILRKARGGK